MGPGRSSRGAGPWPTLPLPQEKETDRQESRVSELSALTYTTGLTVVVNIGLSSLFFGLSQWNVLHTYRAL